MILRQGDLTFLRIGDAKPAEVSPSPVTLALGELSGHWHEAVGGTVERTEDGRYVLNVPGPRPAIVRVQPESHAGRHEPIEVPPGQYEIPGVPSDDSIWVGQAEYVPGAVPRAAGD